MHDLIRELKNKEAFANAPCHPTIPDGAVYVGSYQLEGRVDHMWRHNRKLLLVWDEDIGKEHISPFQSGSKNTSGTYLEILSSRGFLTQEQLKDFC